MSTCKPVEFEKQPVEVQDFRQLTHQFRVYLQNIPQTTKEKTWKMSTCNHRWDLETSIKDLDWFIMPKNLPAQAPVVDWVSEWDAESRIEEVNERSWILDG